MEGYPLGLEALYLIRHPYYHGVTKIGWSRHLSNRIRQFNVACPYKNFEFHSVMPTLNAREVEKEAHKLLASRRFPGTEWFHMHADAVRQYLRQHLPQLEDYHG